MTDKSALFTSGKTGEINRDEWMTPIWLYELLHKEFHFTLDPAADEESALCDFYFDKESNGLESDWFDNVFVNPPYSQLRKWLTKGLYEANHNKKVRTVALLAPARTDTKAWWESARFGEVRFLPGRLRFRLNRANQELVRLRNMERVASGRPLLDPEGTSAPFPSAVVIFNGARNFRPKTIYWNVRESTHDVSNQ